MSTDIKCKECKGSGIASFNETCWVCKGEGYRTYTEDQASRLFRAVDGINSSINVLFGLDATWDDSLVYRMGGWKGEPTAEVDFKTGKITWRKRKLPELAKTMIRSAAVMVPAYYQANKEW